MAAATVLVERDIARLAPWRVTLESARDSRSEPSAESAAVLRYVMAVASMTAAGLPSVPSNST
jgi:hypothetical protein